MKILVLLLAILWISQAFNARKDELPYTYYVYEREWPGTICMFYNCQPEFLENYNGDLFNNHGLWPNGDATNSCAQPGNCMDISYDQQNLMPGLVEILDQQWVGVYNPSVAFRQHEWEKHGTCYYKYHQTTPEQGMNEFFSLVVALNEQYNILPILKEKDIVPDNIIQYDLNTVKAALMEAFGVGENGVKLGCISHSGQQYLASVDMYFDLELKPMDNVCIKKPSSKNQRRNPPSISPCVYTKTALFPTFVPMEK